MPKGCRLVFCTPQVGVCSFRAVVEWKLAQNEAAVGAGALAVERRYGTAGGAGQVALLVGAKILDGQGIALALDRVCPFAAQDLGELGNVCLLN